MNKKKEKNFLLEHIELSRREKRKAFSPESNKFMLKALKKTIQNRRARNVAISFIKAVDLKK